MWRFLLAGMILTTLGCGDDGNDEPRPQVFGGDRPVQLQVPADFDDSRDYPLLLILHGYSATGALQQGFLQLSGVADRGQLLVLAPDGTVNSRGLQFWNADPACCDFDGSGVDDSAYLGGVIDAVRESWPVDPARIMVVGHSNGSYMAYRLACDRSDVITAIAGLAGAAASVPSSCTPSRPVHVLHIHGDQDTVVSYASEGARPGAIESVTQWAGHDGCTGALAAAGRKDLDTLLAGEETAVQRVEGCPAQGAVDLWTIEGGSHVPSFQPSFPDELLFWFSNHKR